MSKFLLILCLAQLSSEGARKDAPVNKRKFNFPFEILDVNEDSQAYCILIGFPHRMPNKLYKQIEGVLDEFERSLPRSVRTRFHGYIDDLSEVYLLFVKGMTWQMFLAKHLSVFLRQLQGVVSPKFVYVGKEMMVCDYYAQTSNLTEEYVPM